MSGVLGSARARSAGSAPSSTEVAIWRTRTLEHIAFPYVFLDATYCKVRLGGRVASQAVVIATGVSADGRREVLGCASGNSETEAFWTKFLRDLRDRGLTGVQLASATPTAASWAPSRPCCRA